MPQCRICGAQMRHLLSCDNMPRAAQHLPTASELPHDRGLRLEICECTACGVVQLANPPVSYWKDVIRAVGISEEMRCFRVEFFSDFVRRYNLEGKKVLELGCGDGAYLRLLAASGLRAYGLEHSAANVELCQAAGLEAQRGYLAKGILLPEAPFDAFFCFSWLEHLPSIPEFLADLLSNLAEGAVGIVEVPNFDMILRGNLVAEFIIDHLYYFSSATFRRTLENHGFDVLSCRPVWHDYILSAELRKRPSLDVHGLRGAWAEISSSLRDIYAKYPKIALWGAGHQALTMIAMAGGAENLTYVVDSAAFKRGRYTPVTHRPIVHPDTLRSQPVDALIVAVGSYCAEVCGEAREKYGLQNIFVFQGNQLTRVEGR